MDFGISSHKATSTNISGSLGINGWKNAKHCLSVGANLARKSSHEFISCTASYSIIFSRIFAGVSQSIFSKTKNDGLNQYLNSFNRRKSKVFNSSSFNDLILSLSLTNLYVPFDDEFNLLNNSIQPGSDEILIFSKFSVFLFEE